MILDSSIVGILILRENCIYDNVYSISTEYQASNDSAVPSYTILQIQIVQKSPGTSSSSTHSQPCMHVDQIHACSPVPGQANTESISTVNGDDLQNWSENTSANKTRPNTVVRTKTWARTKGDG